MLGLTWVMYLAGGAQTGQYDRDSVEPHGGVWEFSKERNDVFGAMGDAVLDTKALVLVCNALRDLVYLSKLRLSPLLPTLSPMFLGNTQLSCSSLNKPSLSSCLQAFAPVLSLWVAFPSSHMIVPSLYLVLCSHVTYSESSSLTPSRLIVFVLLFTQLNFSSQNQSALDITLFFACYFEYALIEQELCPFQHCIHNPENSGWHIVGAE